jgi:hypothetical protein
MPEEKEPPRPHGDKLGASVGNPRNNPEDNQAQVQSDAPPDAVGGMGSEDDAAREESDRDRGRGSSANGVPAFDEDDGAQRKRHYKDGATLVSGID